MGHLTMKLNLYPNNVWGLYLEPLVLRLRPMPNTNFPDFVCVITDAEYTELRTLLPVIDSRAVYDKINAIIQQNQVDIPMWLLAEPGTS